MICLKCLSKTNNPHICDRCNSHLVMTEKNKKYYYQGQAYTKKEWVLSLSTFKEISEKQIKLKYFSESISVEYLRKNFIYNIKKYTFLRLILPCALFLFVIPVILLVSFHIENNAIIIDGNRENVLLFLDFLFAFFTIFIIVFLYKITIKKEKIKGEIYNKKPKYIKISDKDFKNILKILDVKNNG